MTTTKKIWLVTLILSLLTLLFFYYGWHHFGNHGIKSILTPTGEIDHAKAWIWRGWGLITVWFGYLIYQNHIKKINEFLKKAE